MTDNDRIKKNHTVAIFRTTGSVPILFGVRFSKSVDGVTDSSKEVNLYKKNLFQKEATKKPNQISVKTIY